MVDIFYRRCAYPLSYGGDRSPLFLMIFMEKGPEPGPCLEVGGFPSPLSDVFVEGGCLCKNGDTFKHHFRIGNRLPSCTRKFSPLL